MSVDSHNTKEIFGEVLLLDSAEERAAYLSTVCVGNPDLRAEVEELLAAIDSAGDFIERPAVGETRTESVRQNPIGQAIGSYKIREQIGEGGFGIVYIAEQSEPIQRKVALKVIKPGMNSKDVIARFEAERQALALMDHANVARVLDAGTAETGHPYFVMELVRGLPITEFCDKENLTIHERLHLFIDVCRAVQHAHHKGIIHRDIKPTNVLVTLHDGKPVPKVIDFGVAKALSQKLTQHTIYTSLGQMIGTPMYMSPEQAELSGLDVDTRSDVYSLGVLLYELLTGATPFDEGKFKAAGFDELRRIIREDEPLKPSLRVSTLRNELLSTISDQRQVDIARLSQSLKGDLDWVVMKALEKDRDRRYDSPEDLAADVQNFLRRRPVEAGPPSQIYRARKYFARHRGGFITAAVVLLSMILGTGFSVWYAIQAEHALTKSKAAEGIAAERLRSVQEKQTQLEAEQAKLRDEQQVSLINFSLAKGAVVELIDQVAQQRLAAYPELAPLRNSLLETAEEFYTRLIDNSPGDHQLYISRATVKDRLDRSSEALEDLLYAVELQSESSSAHSALAEFFRNTLDLNLRDPSRALEHAQRAVELAPSDKEGWYVLAWVYHHHFPDMQAKAAEAFLKVAELSDDERSKLLHQGNAHKVLRQYKAAIEDYCHAIDSGFTDDYHVYSMRGECYASLREYDKAIQDYTRARELNGFDYENVRRRAQAFTNKREFEKAVLDWEKSLQLAPNLQPNHHGLLKCYLYTQDWAKAAALLDKLPGDYPHLHDLVTNNLNEIIDGSKSDELINARDRLTHRVEEALISKKQSYNAGAFLFALKKYEAAFQTYASMDLKSASANQLNQVAWQLATCPEKQFRNPKRAAEVSRRTLADAKGGIAYQRWNTYAVALYYAGRFEEALDALNTSHFTYADGKGTNAYNAFFYAMTHWQLGNNDEARQFLIQAEEWMNEHAPESEELLRFRREARQLIQPTQQPRPNSPGLQE